jgi:hypothetical protein
MSSDNIRSFLQSLTAYPYLNREAMLELAKILKSLGKPTFLGKRKRKQIEVIATGFRKIISI